MQVGVHKHTVGCMLKTFSKLRLMDTSVFDGDFNKLYVPKGHESIFMFAYASSFRELVAIFTKCGALSAY